jgi:aspartate/methionine/tyrosine aminotransferase
VAKVEMHDLFEVLLGTLEGPAPEAFVGFSLAAPPPLAEFLSDLDPALPLDWNGISFLGLPALRAHVLRQAGLAGVLPQDAVLITAGAAEANYLVLRQILEAGDEIVVEAPGWPQPRVLAQAMGVRVVDWPRDEAAGWALDPDALHRLIGPRTRMVFLTNPNNPTGHVMDDATLHAIAAVTDRAGIWLVVDEVYAGLEWDGPRAPSVAGIAERGITTGSVSKALGLQGLRTGWLVCRDEGLIRDAMVLRENSSEIMNILGEHVAEIALRPDRYGALIDRARADGSANLALLDRMIAGHADLSWKRPAGGLMGLARLAEGLDPERLAAGLRGDPWRTFLIPGTAYGLPWHVRVGVGGGPTANLGEGLRRLAGCLDEGGGRARPDPASRGVDTPVQPS